MRGVIAPFVPSGPIKRAAFKPNVAHVLVPELRSGDIVIMDNLSSLKAPYVRELTEDAGADLLFLPPYSPDFNLIEMTILTHAARVRPPAGACREAEQY